jgi:hypothetical protein
LVTLYDLRSTKLALAAMEEAMASTQLEMKPKKKFAFRKKTTPAVAASQAEPQPDAIAIALAAATAALSTQLPPEDPVTGFYRHTSAVLCKAGASVNGVDVVLTNLTDCTILLLGHPSALRCHNLVRCRVYAGPCSGSVLIYGAVDCEFHMRTRQLRIHDTHRTHFHLQIVSNPIIEHTDTSGFASCDFTYPQLEADLRASGLEGKPSAHQHVEDFNWLRTQHSPNWYAIEEETDENKATEAPVHTRRNARAPVALTSAQVDRIRDMRSDAELTDEQKLQLRQLVQELRIE